MRKIRGRFLQSIMACLIGSALFTSANAATYTPQNSNRVTTLLDTGWLYNKTDNSSFSGTAASESGWENVCVPHPNVITKHAFQSETAFWFISWYRKHFTPPASYTGRRFLLEFEAVATIATVYVNGEQVGSHQGAYTPFTIDITDKVTIGKDNVIAVKVDSKEQSAVPPEGGNLDFMIYGGIVRNVRLIVADPVHVDWAFISTQNPSQTAPTNPTLNVKAKIVNNSSAAKTVSVTTSIVDNSGNIVATATNASQAVPANASVTISQITSAVSSPKLWDIDNPNLYKVYIQVIDGSTALDEYKTRIGIRSMTMNKTDGKFYLNGKAIKLRGLNRHETYPFIGRAAPKRLQRKDADILKFDLGCNIVRTSHYPQAPDFLDRCDEIGLLVLEEVPGWAYVGGTAWQALEMQNLKDMIIRDRNHPALFTFGVRINESADNNTFYKAMNDTARALDPTRLTCGVRRGNSSPTTSFLEDIWTQNFINASANPPNMPVITTEEIGHGYPVFSFSNEDSLKTLVQRHGSAQEDSYMQSKWGGVLGWCAFDYASSHNNAVSLTGGRYVSNHGQADLFRIPKFSGYFYQSQRDPTIYGPMVNICNFWRANSPSTIIVVSNCEQVELFANGTSQGGKMKGNTHLSLPHPWFEYSKSPSAGSLKAVGYIGGKEVASHTWFTPGNPTKITLVPDTNVIYDNGDMTRVVVMVGDANNPFVPYDKTSVTFTVTGEGDFIGESPIAMENGLSAFYVRTHAAGTGTITCTAKAAGLTDGTATITVVKTPIGDDTHIQKVAFSGTPATIQKTLFKQTMSGTFIVPAWAQKNSVVSIYDIAGRLVLKLQKPGISINLNKLGATGTMYLIKITPAKVAL